LTVLTRSENDLLLVEKAKAAHKLLSMGTGKADGVVSAEAPVRRLGHVNQLKHLLAEFG